MSIRLIWVRRVVGVLILMALLIATPIHAQEAPPGVIDKAIEAANQSNPELGRPDSWTWQQLPPTSLSSLGCPLVIGTDMGLSITPYRIALTYSSGVYVLHVSADTTRVQLCDQKFAAMESGLWQDPVDPLAPTATVPADACSLKPIGAFANIRSRPYLDATQVNTIYENSVFPVFAHDGSRNWYLIRSGWVHTSVVELAGNCDSLPMSVAVIYGEGVPQIEPNVYPCPADFAGYLTPRIQADDPYASVTDDGVPNRLRAAPSTSAQIIDEVPPGESFYSIDGGPACNEGHVWWLVSYQDIGGWTAESSIATGQYYLDPWQTPEDVPVDLPDAPPGAVAITGDAGIGTLVFSPGGEQLAVTESSSGDMMVLLFDMEAQSTTPVSQIPHPSPVSNVVIHPSDGRIATSDFQRVNITLGVQPVGGISEPSTHPTGYALAINPNWTLAATTSCFEFTAMGCQTGEVRVWDLETSSMTQAFSDPEFNPHIVEFRSDNRTLLVADFVSVRFWDARNGAMLNSIPTQMPIIRDATFSPDGIMVALGGCLEQTTNGQCARGIVEIWDVTTMTLLQSIETTDRVLDVAFSPDGFYVGGAVGATVEIWGAGTGLKATTLTEFETMVWNIAFSPAFRAEGYTLASLDTGNRVLLWDVALPTAATTSNG